jgi:hypothetical protein
MRFDWPYWTLTENGLLQTDDGDFLVAENGQTPLCFSSTEQAEKYLVDNDIRGNVRS